MRCIHSVLRGTKCRPFRRQTAILSQPARGIAVRCRSRDRLRTSCRRCRFELQTASNDLRSPSRSPRSSPSSLFAWGEKGHASVNEAATLYGCRRISLVLSTIGVHATCLGGGTTRIGGAGGGIARRGDPPEHFLDYDFVSSLTFRPSATLPRPALHLGTLRRYGAANWTPRAFFLEDRRICRPSTNEWRNGFLAGPVPERWTRRKSNPNIIHDAGLLGHYVGDAANPRSHYEQLQRLDSSNPEPLPNDCLTTLALRDTVHLARHRSRSRCLSSGEAGPLRDRLFRGGPDEIGDSECAGGSLYRLDRDGGFDRAAAPNLKPAVVCGEPARRRRVRSSRSLVVDLEKFGEGAEKKTRRDRRMMREHASFG